MELRGMLPLKGAHARLLEEGRAPTLECDGVRDESGH